MVFSEMKRLWWISLLLQSVLQSVLGLVPVIRYKVTDGTKEDSYIGNIGKVINGMNHINESYLCMSNIYA